MSWAVATTPPRCEDKAIEDLKSLDFRCYLPKFLNHYMMNGRRICRAVALFPGYVFFEIEETWKKIFEVIMEEERKISGVIMSGGEPSPIKNSVIDEIRSREGSDGLIKVEDAQQLRKKFFRGQSVRANHGPFIGFLGTFDRSLGENNCRVLFEYMGRLVPVAMRTEEISVDLQRAHTKRRRYYRTREHKRSVPSAPVHV